MPCNPLVLKIQHFLCGLHAHRKFVFFCWIPSHLGLSGKVKADVLAKGPSSYPLVNHNALPIQDYIPSVPLGSPVGTRVLRMATNSQLKPFLGPWSSCSQWCRRLEVSLSRLCIGHTHLTHGHLMAREVPPVCDHCQVHLLIFQILFECPTYSVPLNRFYPSLTSVPPRDRLSLLSDSPTFSFSTWHF